MAVPIPGEHAARPAEEVAAIAVKAGLGARVAGSVGEALDAPCGAELAGSAARADRGVAVSRRGGAGGERRAADVSAQALQGLMTWSPAALKALSSRVATTKP